MENAVRGANLPNTATPGRSTAFAQPERTGPGRVGVVGLGIMGSALASNLLSRGYEVHAYDRTRSRADPLLARGLIFHATPRELASHTEIVLTSLTDDAAVSAVAQGPEGFLAGPARPKLWIDLSTIDPSASEQMTAEAAALGVQRLDAPVSGSRDLAERGTLIVLVGGDTRTFEGAQGLLHDLGSTVLYLGGPGSGHRMKLVINLYLGLMAESLSEALVLARKFGFDTKTFFDTINQTPHRNYYSQSKAEKIETGDFRPSFSLDNLLKDLRLAMAQGHRAGALLPVSEIVLQRFESAAKRGDGPFDFSIVALELQRENGLTTVPPSP